MYNPYNPSSVTPTPEFNAAGGNRNAKHIIGGHASNLGYEAGWSTDMARQGYWNAVNSGRGATTFGNGFFNSPLQYSPIFNHANPTGFRQAAGNQMRATTRGFTMPNKPGQAQWTNIHGNVRQHTLQGNEGMNAQLQYLDKSSGNTAIDVGGQTNVVNPGGQLIRTQDQAPIFDDGVGNSQLTQPPRGGSIIDPPPPPVVTGGGTNNGTPQPNVITDPVKNTNDTRGTVTPPPVVSSGTNSINKAPAPKLTPMQLNQNIRQAAQGWKKGQYVKAADGLRYQIIGGTYRNGVYVPLVNRPGGGTMVHPAWQGL